MLTMSRTMPVLALLLAGCVSGAGAAVSRVASADAAPPAAVPHGSHVTVVLMENKDYDRVVGNPEARYLNETLIPIVAWDKLHDGLLILTWDEAAPDNSGKNHIATVLVGPMVRAGVDDTQSVDHYSVLHTIERIFDVACIDRDCGTPLVKGIWQ